MNIIEHFVNGKNFSGDSNRKSKVFNPSTGEQTADVKLASTKDMDSAIEFAKKAFITWSKKPPLQRARVMFKFKELIEKNFEELTKIIVSEHGKVFDDAKGEITRGLEVVEFACGIPQANSTTSNPLVTSPFASSNTFPCSETIILVNSSKFFSISSLNLNITLAL